MRPCIQERTVAVGELVQRQGSAGSAVMVVKVGLFKGLRAAPGQEHKAIAILGKGRLLGFNNLYRQPAPLTLAAMTPARVCEAEIDSVHALAMVHQQFRQRVYQAVGSHIDCVADWSRILREDSYLLKLCQALHLIANEEGCTAFRIPSHIELANVLGSRRETIARHIGLLIDRGMFRKVDRWHGMLVASACDQQAFESASR
jgi:CRP-like cAMP-binding protein